MISKSELDEMVIQLRAGNDTMIPPIIEHHLPRVEKIASWHSSKYPSKRKDIYGAASFGLVQSVHWACEGRLYDNEITPYINCTIKRFIKDFLEHDHLIPIPRYEFRRQAEKSTDFEFLPVLVAVGEDQYNDDGDTVRAPVVDVTATDNEYRPTMFDDFYRALRLTNRQIEILKLRINGYGLREIGEILGISHQRVDQILFDIRRECVRKKAL